jgi:hypothetical protein
MEPDDDDVLWEQDEERPDDAVQLIDETDDASPSDAERDIDQGETGDAVLGELGEVELAGAWGRASGETIADNVPIPAEDAAVHVVDLDSGTDEAERRAR